MLTQGDKSSVADVYFRDNEVVCNGRGQSNPRQMKGHCLQLITLCTKLVTGWLSMVSGSPDSGLVNDPWGHVDVIDMTPGAMLM